jgi:hypothetical protein
MYSLHRYQPQQLALAYLASQTHQLSPEQFLARLQQLEQTFSQLLNQMPAGNTPYASFSV